MRRGTKFVLTPSLAVLLGATWAVAAQIEDITYLPNDHPAIRYAEPTGDPVARLSKRIESGQVKLDYAPGWGYLPALLKQFGLSIDSQVLVFSKTSFQATKISPRAPRALYFNDEVAIGYVQNGDVLELAALDPKQGVNFYTLDAEKAEKPEFNRRDTCLQCHQGISTSWGSGDSGQFRLSGAGRHARLPRQRHDHRSSQPARSALGRVVRDGHAWLAAPHGQRRGTQSLAAAAPRYTSHAESPQPGKKI
jgi:hypothetical protein